MKKLCRQPSRKTSPVLTTFFLICLFFVKRVMATKHCKYKCKTTFFALPRDAPRFTKKSKSYQKNIPTSSKIGGRRPPKHASEKRPQKKSTQITKMLKIDDFWDPKLWGTNGGWANFSSLFWFRAPLGQPWGPQDPSGPLQTSILDDF